jgi:hypothetical protein
MDIDALHAQVKALTGLNGMLLRKLVSKGMLTTDDAAEIVHGATGAMGLARDAAAAVLAPVEELVSRARPED